jgi:hypothetical protein
MEDGHPARLAARLLTRSILSSCRTSGTLAPTLAGRPLQISPTQQMHM